MRLEAAETGAASRSIHRTFSRERCLTIVILYLSGTRRWCCFIRERDSRDVAARRREPEAAVGMGIEVLGVGRTLRRPALELPRAGIETDELRVRARFDVPQD